MLGLVPLVRSWDRVNHVFAGSILRRNGAVKLTTAKDGVVRRYAEIFCLVESTPVPSYVIPAYAAAVSCLCRLRAIAERSTRKSPASSETILSSPTTTSTYLSTQPMKRTSPRHGSKALSNAARNVVANLTVTFTLAKNHVILRTKRQLTALYPLMWLLTAPAVRLVWMKSWLNRDKLVRTRSLTAKRFAARHSLAAINVTTLAILVHAGHAFKRWKSHVGAGERRFRPIVIRVMFRSQNAFELAGPS